MDSIIEDGFHESLVWLEMKWYNPSERLPLIDGRYLSEKIHCCRYYEILCREKETIVNVKSFLIKFVSLKSFHDVGPHADGLGMINMNNSLSEYNDDKNALWVQLEHGYDRCPGHFVKIILI